MKNYKFKVMEIISIFQTLWIIFLSFQTDVCTQVTLTPLQADVVENGRITLTCSYSGPRSVVITSWETSSEVLTSITEYTNGCILAGFLKNKPDLYEANCFGNNTASVTLKNVRRERNGETWKCVQLFIYSKESRINVKVPISSVTMKSPSKNIVRVPENQETQFICETSGERPAANITWYKSSDENSEEEIKTNIITMESNVTSGLPKSISTLKYLPSRIDNGTKIYCGAINFKGSPRVDSLQKPQLDVQYAPTVIPFNIDPVVEESTLSVECSTRPGNPAETAYSWKRKLSSSSDDTWREIPDFSINGNLLLKTNIKRNDAGTYNCTASNLMRPTAEKQQTGSHSQIFILDVLYQPSVASFFIEGHKGQQHVTFDEYELDMHITCEVESNPPSTIQIMFGGAILKEASDKKVLTFVRSTIECFHSGIYSCQAHNQHGQNSSGNIMVYVRCSPRPIRQVQQNTSSLLYFPVTLSFTALAYPEPGNKGFKWHKLNVMRWIPLLSNKDLKIFSSGSQSNLTILNVSQQDYGQYRVTVTNEIGSYEQYLFLEEEDVQKEPFTKSKCTVETDKTGLIVGICFGLLSAVLTAYSTIVTIALKRKAPRKATPSKDDSKTQASYTNVAKGSTSGSSEYGDTSVKLYTDLARFSTDDKTTYDVIQKI